MVGTIKTLKKEGGFGFIKAGNGVEYFFHRSAVAKDVGFESLAVGERVQFEEGEEGRKGPRAESVERA